ncbi:ribosomal biogenesis protein LAS1L [Megalobrama amblycephala]|uniref:ribosomal biogenesis protein LAS1L n=1 Tax=Megalobrama amblycephala TaxID=75352 RepID=UPI0020140968|nr:ribosomal biogenesis protein LAS1L [Megalobrama amblycephala]XP_048043155.1 ribosomal biogenesis protein LAS1L [Megalobrama amblycephala]
MKKKTMGKTRHVMAWMNKAEFEHVMEYLYSKEPALQKHALHRISAWKGRFGQSTPVAVDSTADLVRCQVLDSMGQLEASDLVLLYGMALVRFVNLITERQQRKVARPLRRLARNINIPEWVVNLRHDLTHRGLPSLKWCRKGCEFVLDWLHQEYWSRQMGSQLTENWNSLSEDEDEEEIVKRHERDLLIRQTEIEAHKKVRELLISYEQEQFQTYEELAKQGGQHGVWPDASADLSWILTQIKHFATEARDIFADVLMHDGFLIPTAEQLESLDIDPSEDSVDKFAPCLPRVFLHFWLPCLKVLNSSIFINLILDKLFAELSNEPSSHRTYYIASWISEILLCNSKCELKAHKKLKISKERIFVNRLQFPWQNLISACVNAPCPATPFLLRQIFSDMDKPLPQDAQRNLLQLCSIYTQGYHRNSSEPSDPPQPVYTLQNLQERLKSNASQNRDTHSSNHTPGSLQAPPTEELQEKLSPEAVQERNSALRGSPWSVCTDKVPWKQYPLGKVPGQPEDPSCLMVESYSTFTVFDQQVELDQLPQHHGNRSVPLQTRGASGSDGLLWTHSDLSKLKAGLKLF